MFFCKVAKVELLAASESAAEAGVELEGKSVSSGDLKHVRLVACPAKYEMRRIVIARFHAVFRG